MDLAANRVMIDKKFTVYERLHSLELTIKQVLEMTQSTSTSLVKIQESLTGSITGDPPGVIPQLREIISSQKLTAANLEHAQRKTIQEATLLTNRVTSLEEFVKEEKWRKRWIMVGIVAFMSLGWEVVKDAVKKMVGGKP